VTETIPTISRPRQERMRKVQDLFDSGMKPKEISEYIGKCERQIYRDLADVKVLNRALIMEVDHCDILGRELRFLQELRRKAMRDYMLCREGDNAKVGYLRTALTAHEKLVKMLQDAGLIKKVPERVAVETAIPFEDPDVRKAYLDFLKLARERGEKNLGL
jgi:hypothetical protein